MNYLWAFLIGGAICAVGQLFIDLTKLTPARILTGYVVAGVVLSAVGLYAPLAEFAGAGASVPLLGFGHLLAKGVRTAVAELPNVEAELYRGLLADYAREKGGHVIVKGLRNATDFDLEYQMAAINRGIWAELETVFLPASVEYQHFSSTMVREMIRYRQPLEKYVPRAVAEELKQKTE